MKKVILAAIIAFTSMAASAQVWMGGSLGLNFTKPEGGEVATSFSIAPEVGYTLSDKWDIAIALNESLTITDGASANSISVEPYARYTFAKTGIVSFFVDGGFGIGSAAVAVGDGDDEEVGSAFAFSIGFKPGVKFAVSEKITLVAKLGFLGYEQVKDSYNIPYIKGRFARNGLCFYPTETLSAPTISIGLFML